jgi:hypothetical protein
MSIADILRRVNTLEQLRSPLTRSHELLRRGVPFKDWPMLELEAFTAESPELKLLPDAELEVLASSEV